MAEKNYGLIPDTPSWTRPLSPECGHDVGPYRVFSLSQPVPPEESGRIRAVARTEALSMYVRSFADGGGENGLHSHNDDATWVVIHGKATFFGEDGELLGELGPLDGVLVPRLLSYKFVCSGETLMARLAGRAPAD